MFPVDLTFNQTIFWPIFLANNPFLGHFRTGLLLDIPTGRKNRLNYCIDWRVNSRHPFIVVSILIRFSVSYQHLKISIPWDARSPQCTKHSWRLHFVTYVTSLFWCRKNPYRWWTHQNIYIYILKPACLMLNPLFSHSIWWLHHLSTAWCSPRSVAASCTPCGKANVPWLRRCCVSRYVTRGHDVFQAYHSSGLVKWLQELT